MFREMRRKRQLFCDRKEQKALCKYVRPAGFIPRVLRVAFPNLLFLYIYYKEDEGKSQFPFL